MVLYFVTLLRCILWFSDFGKVMLSVVSISLYNRRVSVQGPPNMFRLIHDDMDARLTSDPLASYCNAFEFDEVVLSKKFYTV